MTVADVGCGTGYLSVPLAALTGEEGKVIALDISEEMLDELKAKIDRWNIKNIETHLSEENRFLIAAASVDFVLLSMLIHELEDAGLFFREIKRIMKKGGRIGIIEWNVGKPPPGPPADERVSVEELTSMLSEMGLSVVRQDMPGPFHYAILAARSEDLRAEKIEKVGRKLIDELLCLSEKKMRSAVLAERFKAVSSATVAEILREFSERASEKKTPYIEILDNCIEIDLMKEVLGLEKMSEIYTWAKQQGYDSVTRLLMDPQPKGKKYSEFDFVEGRDREDITLGEKRSLAKCFDKDTLDRIIYDEDPIVIKHLLLNPRLVERDVLKIASKRPNKPETLKIIFESKKWISRYVVKRALVMNPCTPTGIALGLVNFMQFKDLKLAASTGTIHEEVRRAAEALLKKNY